MSARFAELLARSFNRFVLLIAQVNKLKSTATLIAIPYQGAYVHGLGRGERPNSLLSVGRDLVLGQGDLGNRFLRLFS